MPETRGTVTADEARQRFDELLNGAAGRGQSYVIERGGKPAAAIVPVHIYEAWLRRREAFFERLDATSKRVNMDPDEAEALVVEAVAAVRAEEERKLFFQTMRDAAARANISSSQAEELIAEAVEAVRNGDA